MTHYNNNKQYSTAKAERFALIMASISILFCVLLLSFCSLPEEQLSNLTPNQQLEAMK